MYNFHKDKERYFNYQYLTSKEYIIPFLGKHLNLEKDLKVLEIGSGEAGVLKAFTEKGYNCVGIELNPNRIEVAKKFFKKEMANGQIAFINKNIYNIDVEKDLNHHFDIIILKDVIEHIPDQERLISYLKVLLTPSGKIFFGFPPWQMPFGGHQQICRSRFLSFLPYFHLLPKKIYKLVLKIFKEKEHTINELIELKETGISIERFEKIVLKNNFKILNKKFFLINPIYKYKFGLKPIVQFSLISAFPFLRNFLTTGVYYFIERADGMEHSV